MAVVFNSFTVRVILKYSCHRAECEFFFFLGHSWMECLWVEFFHFVYFVLVVRCLKRCCIFLSRVGFLVVVFCDKEALCAESTYVVSNTMSECLACFALLGVSVLKGWSVVTVSSISTIALHSIDLWGCFDMWLNLPDFFLDLQ